MINRYKNIDIIGLAPVGGGGNPLRVWVLACFDTVKNFVDWVLSCFIIFRCHPELVSGSCDVKKWRIIYV